MADTIINAAAETVRDGHDEPGGDRLPDLDPSPASVPSAPPIPPRIGLPQENPDLRRRSELSAAGRS